MGPPRELTDQVAVVIARNSLIIGNVSFGRHELAGEIGTAEVDGLRLLAPHFSRAVTIGNLFDMKTIEVATFGTVLDNFAFGIVLVDEHLRNRPCQPGRAGLARRRVALSAPSEVH